MTDPAFPNPNKEMRPVISRLISFIQVKYLLVEINSPEGCICSTPGFSQLAAFVSSFADTIFIQHLPQCTTRISNIKETSH
jgi:hypothetical protein